MTKYKLGIDLGSTSLGWCLLELNSNNQIKGFLDGGVRIFPDGRDAKTKEPLSVGRREARGKRRNRDRYLKRRKRLLNILIENGLMPTDRKERKKLELLNPYLLRKKGLDEKLNLHEFGRALFHLNQRRGFKSNRRLDSKQDEKGKIYQAYKKLKESVQEKGARTLGELLYNASQDFEKEEKRSSIRFKNEDSGGKKKYEYYPYREMYEDEFDLLWDKQSSYHKGLNNELRNKIRETIFHQRSLRPQEVGFCTFVDGAKRIAKADPLFQLFRIYDNVNKLDIASKKTGECELLTKEHKEKIIDALLTRKKDFVKNTRKITFKKLKKLTGFDDTYVFNLESPKRAGLNYDTVAGIMSSDKCFGDSWFDFSLEEQRKIVKNILGLNRKKDGEIVSDEELINNLIKDYKLDYENAYNIINSELEPGYASLSEEAILKILPFLKEGYIYSDACKKAGFHHSDLEIGEAHDLLEYYGKVLPKQVIGGTKSKLDENNPEKYYGKINNPTVHIALNQLRRVLNKLIDVYGKPEEIVVELARDLKIGRKELRKIEKVQEDNQKFNEKAKEELEKLGVKTNRDNIIKYKVWDSLSAQNKCCPFTGKAISINDLFSPNFEIEHLLPWSRTFDDSLSNKVISHVSANRYKKNRTPYEAFGESKDGYDWDEIFKRAEKMPDNKKLHFKPNAMEKYQKDNGPIARQLNDTRYMSKIAVSYLKTLYGKDNESKVYSIPGQLTALLRYSWGLNKMKNKDDAETYRTDHRHHILDAFVVGCTSRGALKRASDLANKAESMDRGTYENRKKLLKGEFLPYENFNKEDREKLEEKISNVAVSYKPNHKGANKLVKFGSTSGQLHEDTCYGPTDFKASKKDHLVVSIRKDIFSIEKKHIETIFDNKTREDLKKLTDSISDKKEIKSIVENYAKQNNIKKVKCLVEKSKSVLIPIYSKDHFNGEKPYKYYIGGNNYCADVYCLRSDDKKHPNLTKKWHTEVISNFEANKKGFVPNWRKKYPTAKRIMKLFIDDIVALTFDKDVDPDSLPKGIKDYVISETKKVSNNKVDCFFKVKKLSKNQVFLRSFTVSKEDKDKFTWEAYSKGLLERKARKVYIDEIGRVYDPGFKQGF